MDTLKGNPLAAVNKLDWCWDNMFQGRTQLLGQPVDWVVDSRVKIAVEPPVDMIRQMQLAHAVPLVLVLCQ